MERPHGIRHDVRGHRRTTPWATLFDSARNNPGVLFASGPMSAGRAEQTVRAIRTGRPATARLAGTSGDMSRFLVNGEVWDAWMEPKVARSSKELVRVVVRFRSDVAEPNVRTTSEPTTKKRRRFLFRRNVRTNA
jgi:hypothetical protein